MSIRSELNVITHRLLDTAPTDYGTLRAVCHELHDFLVQTTRIDPHNPDNRKNRVHSDMGYAISLTWAAMCIHDFQRTKTFTDGLFRAVSDRLAQQPDLPVHILYAGTGPFATLILPLVARFSPQQVQFTLLEINAQSYACLTQLITLLDLAPYVSSVQQVDATTWQIPDPHSVDVFVTETMQKALKEEQQVAISLNIVPQLRPDALLIPEQIRLTLALIHYQRPAEAHQIPVPIVSPVADVFLLNRETLWQHSPSYRPHHLPYVFPSMTIATPQEGVQASTQPHLLTEITVYQNVTLNFNQSGLTMPFPLRQFSGKIPAQMRFEYNVDRVPGLRVTALPD
ncbi:hypothetical protein F5984_20190 [Rudanella paleaurantiibacter]|uniref:Phytanoyl-CoA dioxygenase n=1 Tax=Rudanella paleaurantiibacter TaxID=2614655 RepID=A0A7J5TV99_9BACT|nr:hypothetical protein [Rudanella paleaurantiibacter]KAB7728074.1 hypothetical protein F5984_20190 [Rudanella paleaurantiibacter]